MITSTAGRAFIENQEGRIFHVYQNAGDVPTIGCGHVVRPGEIYPCTPPWPTGADAARLVLAHDADCEGITDARIDEILAGDLRVAEAAVNSCVHAPLTQNQFDALVDFAFNEGGGALASSTAVRLLNGGDADGAADALLMWDKSPGVSGDLVTNPVLLARRQAERALFLTG